MPISHVVASRSLVLDLQPVRADIDLQAVRLLLGLVEIIAEHAHRDDQRADDEVHDVAIAGHLMSPRGFKGDLWGDSPDLSRYAPNAIPIRGAGSILLVAGPRKRHSMCDLMGRPDQSPPETDEHPYIN